MGYYATDTTSRGKQYFRPQAHDNRKTPTVVHTAGGLGKHDFWRKTAGSCYFESEALGDSKPNKKWWNPTSKSRSGGFASAQGQTSSTSVKHSYREELSLRTRNESAITQTFENFPQSLFDERKKHEDWAVEKRRQSDWDTWYREQVNSQGSAN